MYTVKFFNVDIRI